jgi:anti-sigma factor RsiW
VAKKPVEIDCKDVWRQISNYLDDEVDPGLRATMSSHFKDCAHCTAVLDGARGRGQACRRRARIRGSRGGKSEVLQEVE